MGWLAIAAVILALLFFAAKLVLDALGTPPEDG